MFIPRFYACNIDLFPLNWYIVRFEDSFDGFCDFGTNTITYDRYVSAVPYKLGLLKLEQRTWDKCDSILSPKFRWLEDVGLYRSHCYAELSAESPEKQLPADILLIA